MEFALVVPLLLMFVLGIAEFGRAYSIQMVLSAAAREGARSVALGSTAATAQSTAVNAVTAARPSLSLPATAVTVSPTTCTTGASATVTVNYTMPYLSKLFGTSKALKGIAVMRCNG